MKKCKSCQTEIDAKATKCPHCQTDQRGWVKRHPFLTIILGLVIFFIIGSNSSKNTTPTSNTTTKTNDAKSQPTTTSVSKAPAVPAEYRSALNKATTYANTMHMSKKGVYNQLVSEYGEKFSPEAAQYGIDNVKTDWNANALAKAKTYQDSMSMSPSAIRNQLTSDAGEKFTQAEADYAIQNLNK
ncbi:MAG: Ltp family lipoprotein [Candidatus Roizmanbacteria bacterium]|nr:Ltp family lipoprotein [Candidatus Roizmanbacteria bacterium]